MSGTGGGEGCGALGCLVILGILIFAMIRIVLPIALIVGAVYLLVKYEEQISNFLEEMAEVSWEIMRQLAIGVWEVHKALGVGLLMAIRDFPVRALALERVSDRAVRLAVALWLVFLPALMFGVALHYGSLWVLPSLLLIFSAYYRSYFTDPLDPRLVRFAQEPWLIGGKLGITFLNSWGII